MSNEVVDDELLLLLAEVGKIGDDNDFGFHVEESDNKHVSSTHTTPTQVMLFGGGYNNNSNLLYSPQNEKNIPSFAEAVNANASFPTGKKVYTQSSEVFFSTPTEQISHTAINKHSASGATCFNSAESARSAFSVATPSTVPIALYNNNPNAINLLNLNQMGQSVNNTSTTANSVNTGKYPSFTASPVSQQHTPFDVTSGNANHGNFSSISRNLLFDSFYTNNGTVNGNDTNQMYNNNNNNNGDNKRYFLTSIANYTTGAAAMESTPSRHDHNNNNNKVVTPSEVVELKELLLRSILHVDRQNYNNVNNPFENYKLFVTLNLGPIQFRDNHCDIVTLLLSYCKNQKGCRTLQTIMEEEYSAGGATNEVENSWIIQALLSALQHNYTHASSGAPTGISSFSEVMADSYGNFIIQKMFLLFNKKMRRFILTETNLKFNLFNNISNSRHGTFAVQKLIETIPNKDSGRDAESNTRLTEEEENIIADIFNQYTNVKELLINEYGVHVVYKFLSYINTRYAEGNHPNSSAVIFRKVSFIYFTIIKNKNIICNTKNGCCAVQKVIKYFFNFFYEGGKGGEEGSNFFVQFVSGIIFNDDQNNAGTNNYTLCSNAFGNYVIGLILEISFTNQGPLATVLQQFSANLFHDHFHPPQKNNPLLLSLCKNKFSSNVLEKVLEYSEEGTMRKYTEFLLFPSTTGLGGHPVNLTEIVTDSIGNYVIQTYLRYVPSPLLTTPFHPTGLTVLQCLKDAIPLLEHRKFGEKMKSQIKLAEMKANE